MFYMGFLISIEGGEFTGKSSLIVPSLKKILELSGCDVRVSREPGGTPRGEKIRSKIFSRLSEGTFQEELALLFNEARKIHLQDIIFPFLGSDRNKEGVLILDRFLDSTIVYQGLEGGVDLKKLVSYEKEYANSFYPDITLITFFPENKFNKTFEMRRNFANTNDKEKRSQTKWDEGEVAFHLQRQRHYLSLPDFYKKMGIERNFTTIDSSKHPYEVIKESVVKTSQLFKEDKKEIFLEKYKELVLKKEWEEFSEIWEK